MKKRKQKLCGILCMVAISICLIGCGLKENAATHSEAEVTEDSTDASGENPEEISVNKEETAVDETEVEKPEESTPETVKTDDEQEVESEADEVSGETEEMNYLADFFAIAEYMNNLDPKQPAIVIYNVEEHYIFSLKDEQKYQMKKGDYIALNSNATGNGYSEALLNIDQFTDGQDSTFCYVGAYNEENPYSSWKEDETLVFSIPTETGDMKSIKCYVTPAAE